MIKEIRKKSETNYRYGGCFIPLKSTFWINDVWISFEVILIFFLFVSFIISFHCERKYDANIEKALHLIFLNTRCIKFCRKEKKKDYFNNVRYISVYMCFITFIPFSITSRLHSFTSEVKFPLEELSPFHFIFYNAFRWKQSNRESQNDIAEEFYIFSLIFTTTFT